MREQVNPEQLIIHSDRGSSMKSKTLFELYTDLGVAVAYPDLEYLMTILFLKHNLKL